MVDKATDASKRNKLSFARAQSMESFDKSVEPNEEFIGLYKVDEISFNTITNPLNDVLQTTYLSISNCLGQSYDGASNMSGIRQGKAT